MPLPVRHVPPLVQQLIDYTFPAYPSITGPVQPVTFHSIGIFLFALGWAIVLLISFTGWGRLVGKLAHIERLPTSVACSLGIAATVFLGGMLNLAQAIYPGVLFGLAALGVLAYAALLKERPDKYRWGRWDAASPSARNRTRILLVATLVILAFRVAANVRLAKYNNYDDGQGYMVFPGNMLAYHHVDPGPFSDRHIISSVGGGYLLQAMVISATSIANIGMADRVFGLMLLFAALWDLGTALGLQLEQIALLEFLAYLVPQQTDNLTFTILPVSLLLSILWLIFAGRTEKNEKVWRYALLAGAVGGATVALKSTVLPCGGAFCLAPYLAMHWRRKQFVFMLPPIAGIGALLVMGAWMLALKHTGGTFLYPVLGRGLDYSSYGVFHSFTIAKTPRTFIKLFLHAIALFGLGVPFLLFRPNGRKAMFSLAVLLAAASGITAFNLVAGGDAIWRYGFPAFFAAVLIYSATMTALSNSVQLPSRKKLATGLAILSLLGCTVYYDLAGKRPEPGRQFRWEFVRYPGELQASLSGRSLSSPATIRQYEAINAALRFRGATLENVADPYLLKEEAHRIFFMDWPGAAGPKPGWPFGQDAATLAHYLLNNSVRYVAYDRSFGRWIDVSSCRTLEWPQRFSAELYVLFWMSLLSHDQIRHLAHSYGQIYDDGQIVVVDLNRPLANAAPERPVWSMDTDKDQMCSEVMKRYLAHPLLVKTR